MIRQAGVFLYEGQFRLSRSEQTHLLIMLFLNIPDSTDLCSLKISGMVLIKKLPLLPHFSHFNNVLTVQQGKTFTLIPI